MDRKILSMFMLLASLCACSDFTDVKPKGVNLLSTTTQLEMLLNSEYTMSNNDMRTLAGDQVVTFSNVATELSAPQKTKSVILWTWDEAEMDKLAELTASDATYTTCYEYIGKIANPILQQLPNAQGSEQQKKQLRCEALTLRAWAHFLLVNKFAKAYRPETAETDNGIVYMTENVDITTPQPPVSVKDVYEKILADANEAIQLDGLPNVAANHMRMNRACPYAIKALALLNMQQWKAAKEAAQKAIEIQPQVTPLFDNAYQSTVTGFFLGNTYPCVKKPNTGTEEDYFMVYNLEFFNAYSPESWNNFEKGHIYHDRMATLNMAYDYLQDPAIGIMGESNWIYTYDLVSGWNECGLRSTQMYEVIAESAIHEGKIDEAMSALDKIRMQRIDAAVYRPLQGNVDNVADAIAHVKQVSCNENMFSCFNFVNKKRWNQVAGWQEVYQRTLAGNTYTLKPDSKMWVFPIPMNAMNNNPNLKQNYK